MWCVAQWVAFSLAVDPYHDKPLEYVHDTLYDLGHTDPNDQNAGVLILNSIPPLDDEADKPVEFPPPRMCTHVNTTETLVRLRDEPSPLSLIWQALRRLPMRRRDAFDGWYLDSMTELLGVV